VLGPLALLPKDAEWHEQDMRLELQYGAQDRHKEGGMRVLIVNHRGDVVSGGVEQALLRWVRASAAEGVSTYVALPEHGPLADALQGMSTPHKVLDVDWQPRTDAGRNRYLEGLPARVAILADWIRQEKIDLVHTNTFNLLEGALAAIVTGRPHVWHVRSVFGTDPPPYALGGLELTISQQAQFLSMLADRILTVSAHAAEAFRDGPLLIECIPNGIDLDEWERRKKTLKVSDLRDELGLAENTPLIANVARISVEKDLPTVVSREVV
jgi:glycosyltransferase involved in cell wall biosynthesis